MRGFPLSGGMQCNACQGWCKPDMQKEHEWKEKERVQLARGIGT